MLKIEGKTFMNIQEAVQWLLDNNALPFQCTANYAPLTEIGLGTIVNPTPAKVRIGSLIFFADSKVSTVVGITETGFICSDQYNNLVDDVAYVTNVAINASGHLITTFSDGQTQDAGLIKQVSSFSIDASQHLIVTYNDGTTADLGAIFSGDITIAGNLAVTGDITGPKIDCDVVNGDEIVENMTYRSYSGYMFTPSPATTNLTREYIYASVVKNGNKITFVVALNLTRTGDLDAGDKGLGTFIVPVDVGNKLYPTNISGVDFLAVNELPAVIDQSNISKINSYTLKKYSNNVEVDCTRSSLQALTLNQKYYVRYECTFLLSENLAS